jgi:hypothetical protein
VQDKRLIIGGTLALNPISGPDGAQLTLISDPQRALVELLSR